MLEPSHKVDYWGVPLSHGYRWQGWSWESYPERFDLPLGSWNEHFWMGSTYGIVPYDLLMIIHVLIGDYPILVGWLSNIIQYYPILSNIIQYYPINYPSHW